MYVIILITHDKSHDAQTHHMVLVYPPSLLKNIDHNKVYIRFSYIDHRMFYDKLNGYLL